MNGEAMVVGHEAGRTLPRQFYVADHVFAAERENLFHQQWFCVGRRDQLPSPGSYLLADVAGESVIVAWDAGSKQLHASFNVCRHRGCRLLVQESGNLPHGRIQCPYHRWSYNSDGRLIAAPGMESDPDFNREDWPLCPARVDVWEGFVFVNLSKNPRDIAAAFAPFIDRLQPWRVSELTVVHREQYTVATNWKLVFQNFSECYHCRSVHPGLNELSPVASCSNDFTSGPFLGGPMQLSGQSMTRDGKLAAPVIRTLHEVDRDRVYYYTLLPNMMFGLHPDFVVSWRLLPAGPGETRIVTEWLFEPETLECGQFNAASAVEFWDTTNRQDWNICEQNYLGVQSIAYQPGPWSPRESMPQAFDEEYCRVMTSVVGSSAS